MGPRELGFRVRERRKELSLSQVELAQQAGISRVYLSEIERGRARRVSKNILARLTAALKSTQIDLMNQSGHSQLIPPPAPAGFFPEAKESEPEVIEWLGQMPEKWKRLVRPRHEGDPTLSHQDADVIATGREGGVYFVYCFAPTGRSTPVELEVENAFDKAGLSIVRRATDSGQPPLSSEGANELRS